MWVYFDESGHPHPNDSCPKSVLVAVCIEESINRDMTRNLHNMKKDLLGTEDCELKGSSLLRKSTFEKVVKKRELVECFFNYLRDLPFTVFAMIMPRPSRVPNWNLTSLPNQYEFLLLRVQNLALEMDDKALLIFDDGGPSGIWQEHGPSDINLARAITNYLFRHAVGKSLDRIYEVPMFVKSLITPGVQIADMIARCIRIYEEKGLYTATRSTDPFESAIRRYYGIIEDKKRDFIDESTTMYGFSRLSDQVICGLPLQP